MNKRNIALAVAISLVVSTLLAYTMNKGTEVAASDTVRIGYFPNISHAQALVGIARGTFEQELGNTTNIQYKTFGAGPSAVEALFTNQVDITYVGPSPAINGYIRSDGNLKIIAGAASGGAVFVVRNDANIQSPADFAGKKFASPQYGNTQDISLKSYIIDHGYRLAQHGGSVHVLSAKNSDIMTLFLKKEIDGAWVPEPWGTLLVKNANGKIFVDERDLWEDGEFATTLLVVSNRFLQERPDLVKKVLKAHVETTIWINANPEQAEQLVNEQLEKILHRPLPDDVLRESFSRMKFTYGLMKPSVIRFAEEGYSLDLLGRDKPDLSGIYYTELLSEVLREKNLPFQ
ncbi:MAG: ABC transporter substrate-binding protein [Nitrososphaerales archaeon]